MFHLTKNKLFTKNKYCDKESVFFYVNKKLFEKKTSKLSVRETFLLKFKI